jgi:hypothetical protein
MYDRNELTLCCTATPSDLQFIGYSYNEATDKWFYRRCADLYIISTKLVDFNLLQVSATSYLVGIMQPGLQAIDTQNIIPPARSQFYRAAARSHANFIALDVSEDHTELLELVKNDETVILCIYSNAKK